MILTTLDKEYYFPTVSQTGSALEGLLVRAQAVAESPQGANRPLEVSQRTEQFSVSPDYLQGVLSLFPVVSIDQVRLRYRSGTAVTDWADITDWIYDENLSRINLNTYDSFHRWAYGNVDLAEVTYTAGFDFTSASREVDLIKAITGAVVTNLASKAGEGLFQYQLDDENTGITETSRFDFAFLERTLQPLHSFRPRAR